LGFSGGLDSAAIAFWRRPDVCITIDYGQNAAQGEMTAAESLCKHMRLKHRIIRADLSALGSGTMANQPTSRTALAPEFWPYRNQMLITLGAMLMQPHGLKEIWIGAVSTDRHRDGRPSFIRAVDTTMRIQEGRVKVHAPAITLNSVQLLKKANFPKRLVGLTFSCHVHRYACGQCGGCRKHLETVERAYA
jgi:7-cyano-7-deazaguanine synthase